MQPKSKQEELDEQGPPCVHGIEWHRCSVSCENCGHQCRNHPIEGGLCTVQGCDCDDYRSTPG